MGYYIDCGQDSHHKATWLFDHCDARILTGPPASVPKGWVPVCVVECDTHEAAGIAFNRVELERFADKKDKREKQWLLVPKETAIQHCNNKDVAKHIEW